MQPMIGIVFGLLSALCQGFGYVAMKKSYRKLNPSLTFAMDACWGLLIWIPYALFAGIDFSQIPQVLPYALLSGILSEAFVFFALSRGEISLTGSLFATYPIFTILFSHFINHDQLNAMQWITILLVIFGTVLITLPTRVKNGLKQKKMYLVWPLLAAFAVGISDTLSKHVIDQTSAPTFLFCLSLAQIPVAIGYLLITYKHHMSKLLAISTKIITKPSDYRFAYLGSLGSVFCVLFLWLSFGTTIASIASPLTASYPLYIVFFAHLILKEKIPAKDWPGITLILENTILLTMMTSTVK
jgi:drug/metabolite transporter (DMT)-like permease